jgi:hypothetical protein
MKATNSRFVLIPAIVALAALSFSGCATAPVIPSADSKHCEIYLCETFNHDLVNISTDLTQVFSQQITTKSGTNLATVTTIPAKESPIHLRIEVPAHHARLVQTIDPKKGRYLMISMDQSYQLSVTQRVDQPALD